jgi:hypothetical protein
MLEAMLERSGRLKGNESVVSLLDRFTRFLGRIIKDSEAVDLWTILHFSSCLSSVAGLNTVLKSQARYLSKLEYRVVSTTIFLDVSPLTPQRHSP